MFAEFSLGLAAHYSIPNLFLSCSTESYNRTTFQIEELDHTLVLKCWTKSVAFEVERNSF